MSEAMNNWRRVEVRVPMNIAFVKYWGKRDENLILPLNDSISMTVDELTAKTTVILKKEGEHSVEINQKSINLESNQRYKRVFNEALRLLWKRNQKVAEENRTEPESVDEWKFEIKSETTFPVAAGLASSAAGFAAIALGIQYLLDLDDCDANRLARIGSGSACRSMSNGLIRWRRGIESNGSDSLAEKATEHIWEDLCCLIFVFDDQQKKIGSSEGMRMSVETSELLKYRAEHIVDKRIERIIESVEAKNFDALAKEIMADSNQFHAICLDTQPPIKYLNEKSWKLIEIVEEFNRLKKDGLRRAAYTFDAGPNACVILEKKTVSEFCDFLSKQIWIPHSNTIEMLKNVANNSAASKEFAPTHVYFSKMGGAPQIVQA